MKSLTICLLFAFSATSQASLGDTIRKDWNALTDDVKHAESSVVNKWHSFENKLENMENAVKDDWHSLEHHVNNGVNDVEHFFANGWHKVENFLETGIDDVKDFFERIWNSIVSKVNEGKEDIMEEIQQIEHFFNDKYHKLIEKLHDGVEAVKHLFEHKKAAAQQEFEDIHQQALIQLKSYPDICTAGMEQRLWSLKNSRFGDFIHCSNLTEAVSDVGDIIYDTAALIYNFINTIDEMAHAFTSCASYMPWKLLPCITEKIRTVVNDFMADINVVKSYWANVTALGHNISEIIDYCKAAPIVNLTGESNKMLYTAHVCSRFHQPVQLY